mmetsp:Transcript_36788/g.80391  ORF Transcript_36788/g.80391 Transcript_36788/m.80391 type:complete len:145 (-) Transcript_36788:58-492(-)
MAQGSFDSIEIVEGLTEYSNRVNLKSVFSQFGEVEVCWVPPPNQRQDVFAFIRFRNRETAATALQACQNGAVFLDGMFVKARPRQNTGPGSKGTGSKGGGKGGRSRSSSSTPPRLRAMERRRREQRDRRSRSRDRRRRDSRGRR